MSSPNGAGPDVAATTTEAREDAASERPMTSQPEPTPQARRRLGHWRASEIRAFEFEGRAYRASVSRFSDGTIGEIFLDAAKYGSDIATHAAESAVMASVAMQYGTPAEALIHSTNGPISKALALFTEGER